jgi:hypothetical protein
MMISGLGVIARSTRPGSSANLSLNSRATVCEHEVEGAEADRIRVIHEDFVAGLEERRAQKICARAPCAV